MAQALLLFRRGCIARREEVDESSSIVTADGRHCGYYAKSGFGRHIDRRHRKRGYHSGQFLVQDRSEEHTSELQSLMRISYAVFCLKKKKKLTSITYISYHLNINTN